MRAALLSKKTQSNFLLHLLFTWSEDNNSFFNQCRAFPLSPCPPISSDTDTMSIKVQVLQGRKTRQDDLENFFKMDFPSEDWLALPWYLSCQCPRARRAVVRGSAIAVEYFAPSLPRGSCQGPGEHLPTRLPLPLMCEQAGEAAHRWGPAQPPPMLKEGLSFGNGEGGAVGGLGVT